MLLYIIRHGDPIYEPDSLTDLGHEQAKALVPRLAPLGFDKIYVSPMIRAQQTAAPTCEALGMTPVVRPFLSEQALFEEVSMMLPKNEDPSRLYKRWCFHQQETNYKPRNPYSELENWFDIPAFAGCRDRAIPAYRDFIAGADSFLSELGYHREDGFYRIDNPPYERVAVFCHQGVGLTWIAHMLNIPPQMMWSSFDITHTGVTVLDFKNYKNNLTTPICLCLSDTAHLFGADMEIKHCGIQEY
ncbi:MAG: histidine phosphatase family protein [Clostridia bacterium]|nr:histidine phosphatase family protein [Oscillospiraceae bacterium]MBR6694728.1 histidine phosphatase family protein [Clostridia bacterium]